MPKRNTQKIPARASHDTTPPKALLDFMMTGWEQRAPKAVRPIKNIAAFAARRAQLSERFPKDVLLIPTGHEKIRANDTTFRFRPGSDFYYLTGNTEPDCLLALVPREGASRDGPKKVDARGDIPMAKNHEAILFVEAEVDRSTPAFFTDRARGALWVGARLGLEGSKTRYGVERTLPLSELEKFLESVAGEKRAVRLVRGISPTVDQIIRRRRDKKSDVSDNELSLALAQVRIVKDSVEIAALSKAIATTLGAYEAAIRAIKTAKVEREIETAFDAFSRAKGAGVGYGTIVACGSNATTLHWTRNDGAVTKGDLVLIDAGAESDELYTADITRTFPISGRFTKEQRKLYDLVVQAQDAAIKEVRPGNDFMGPHQAATKVLVEGLEKMGLLIEPASEAMRNQTYKRYTLHNTSHMLGIDVHDNSAVPYRDGKLEAGMVLTIEPGLYFQKDDLTVPKWLRGIGIRIEEDVLVTKTGCRVLSKDIPRTSKEIEDWMSRVWKARM